MSVKPKKNLGQHFLTDERISQRIANQWRHFQGCNNVLEIGPGMGAMTKYLLADVTNDLYVMELDMESVEYLQENYPQLQGRILSADFLKYDLTTLFKGESFAVVGNFPYNISSQILFTCLEHKDRIPEIMGMFQKEVAERVAVGPGTKQYGIISVLLQAFYDIEYCFTVDEHVFNPPPKVKSGVIRLTRNGVDQLPCDEKLFKRIVKACFNQRRKMIRNSIKPFLNNHEFTSTFAMQRPEQLFVDDFISLTLEIEKIQKDILS